jgi:anti-anti-sigma regulatory factor
VFAVAQVFRSPCKTFRPAEGTFTHLAEKTRVPKMVYRLLFPPSGREEAVFNICVETVGDVAVVQCAGRLVRSEAAFELRDAVMSQREARIVVVDLSEVQAIEGGGLGMLGYVHRWAHNHDIKMKLFNPPRAVEDRLGHSWRPPLEIVTMDEMIALLNGGGRTVTRDQGDTAFC